MTWPLVTVDQIKAKTRYSLVGGPFGSNLVTRDYREEGVPIIRGSNVPGDKVFSYDDLAFVSEEKADDLLPNNANPGDLVVTQRGTLGQVGLIPLDSPYPRFVISQSQMKLTVDSEIASAKFVYYYFCLPETIQRIKSRAITSGVPHINLDILKRFELPLPSFREQERIASILSAYDDLIENNRRRIQLLEQAARLIYQEWFVRLRFPGHELVRVVDGVPEGWEWHTLGELCASLTDGDWVESKDQGGEDFRLLQVSNIGVNKFIETGNYRYISEDVFRRLRCREIVPGDILISRMPKPVGRAWLVTAMPWRMITAVDVAVAAVDEEQVSPLLVLYYLNSPSNFQLCETYITGATRPRITRSILRSFRLLVPPRRLQRMFDRQIEPIQDQMVKLRQTNEKLRQARDLLLPKLMSGEIEV